MLVTGTGASSVFKDQPNYESAKDAGENNEYDVIVRATEETAVGGGPRKADELTVSVRVTDVNEAGKVTLNWLQPRSRHRDHGHNHRPRGRRRHRGGWWHRTRGIHVVQGPRLLTPTTSARMRPRTTSPYSGKRSNLSGTSAAVTEL